MRQIVLVDVSGEARERYLPLGIAYLKAALSADATLTDRVRASLKAFLADTAVASMALEIAAERPSIVGFSCQGWNIRLYEQLLPTLRQLLPDVVIVIGGNHVTGQGAKWLRRLPEVDIVVNGEGEATIRDIVRWHLDGHPNLASIRGITFRNQESVITTDPRPRAGTLDEVPSPFLLNGIEPDIDVVLWETNRGCPYHCAFCYWGGAVGQKVSQAVPDRLRAELDVIGRSGAPSLFICDANFGILPQDVEVARMVVETRQRHGAPRTLHVNWAKNHAARVGEILAILRAGDVHTNVYLALQTLEPRALELAGRDERGRAGMMDLAQQIIESGGSVGAELIFGLPGETLDQFRAAYDQLVLKFPSLLLHPLWVLPNTTYDQDRARFGLVTIRPDPLVDYEGVLRHDTLTVEDNRTGLELLLADEILVGTGYARTTVQGLARWGDHRPTTVLDRFIDFVRTRDDPLSATLRAAFETIRDECYFHRQLRGSVRAALFADRERALALLESFVNSLDLDVDAADACLTLARYDCALLPRSDVVGPYNGEELLDLDFDVPGVAADLLRSEDKGGLPARHAVTARIRHRAGFAKHQGDAIDLSAIWRGRVISVQPKHLVTR